MQKNKFDVNSKLAIKYAGEYASTLCCHYVDIEHFFLGIIKDNSSFASKLLTDSGITTDKLITFVKFMTPRNELIKNGNIDLSNDAIKAIEKALEYAKINLITPDHILLGILKEPCAKAIKVFQIFNVKIEMVYGEILKKVTMPNYINIKTEKKKNLESKILNQFGKELVSLASNKMLDPMIGRESEIESMICILSRRRKNNPAIIGEAGVGKTALVDGLAYKIARGEVPLNLANKKIVSLDLSSIIAGTKYRGEFEDRVKNIAEECKKLEDIILFIDELHIIMGAGGAEGAIDAANILKPALSRSQIQIIGATTLEEYRKNIEKDSALERRFQKIIVSEPSQSETIHILNGIKNHFEAFHKVKITENAIHSAVSLSSRYFLDRRLPDKAIDLIDEACANYNLQNIKKFAFETSSIIDACDIQQIVSKYTGIDAFELNENSKVLIENLKNTLNSTIIGQDDACERIISAVKRAKIGLSDPNRPLGSFVFLGPTGVGKTEICKALAKGLFKNEKSIIRVDMSEFMDKSSITKLIGASAGYVGYGEQTAITEKVRNNPFSVILLDEIEKAHPDILNLLLQILEDGTLTDSQHRKINFKNTIIVMTSNIGAVKIINKSLGFLDGNQDIKNNALAELKKVFKPELINRIDELVVFNKLTDDNIYIICQNMLVNLQERTINLGITVHFSENLIKHLAKKGYSNEYGARPLRRLITEFIENPLTDKIINKEVIKGDDITIEFLDDVKFIKTECSKN